MTGSSSSRTPEPLLRQIQGYIEDARSLTADLDPRARFSGPQLLKYLNSLPSGFSPFTRVKLEYMRTQGVLQPESTGEGTQRVAWRYSPEDAQLVLVVERLKNKTGMSLSEIKSWLDFFEESQKTKSVGSAGTDQRKPTYPLSTSSALLALREYALGTLLTALLRHIQGNSSKSLIALRVLNSDNSRAFRRRDDTAPVKALLQDCGWHVAVKRPLDQAKKQFLEEFSYSESTGQWSEETELLLQQRYWYRDELKDALHGCTYEIIVGPALPRPNRVTVPATELDSPEAPIYSPLDAPNGTPFDFEEGSGLATLLQIAFAKSVSLDDGGTPLTHMAQLIAEASDAWTYSAILIPNEKEELCVTTFSRSFPSTLVGRCVSTERFLSGWPYSSGLPVVVEETVEGDPRVSFFDDEEKPAAAAAVPATVEQDGKSSKQGVVYVARKSTHPRVDPQIFTPERLAALEMLGTICADLILREKVKATTIRDLAYVTKPSTEMVEFKNVQALFESIIDALETTFPEAVESWIHVLTLRVDVASSIISDSWQADSNSKLQNVLFWIYAQSCIATKDFLTNLFNSTRNGAVRIGYCKVDDRDDKYIFATLRPSKLLEKEYKEHVIEFRNSLERTTIEGLEATVHPWSRCFSYAWLRRVLTSQRSSEDVSGKEHLIKLLTSQILETVEASLAISLSDKAFNNNPNSAVTLLKNALKSTPNHYLNKQLAKIYLLINNFERAEYHSRRALEESQGSYTAARCLRADSLAYLRRYAEAFEEYERAIEENPSRLDFPIRYGIALTTMISAGEWQLPDPSKQPAYEIAIRQFLLAETRNRQLEGLNDSRRALYYYYRGYTYYRAAEALQKQLHDKNSENEEPHELIEAALLELTEGRRLDPRDMRLAQLYADARNLQRRLRSELVRS